MDRMIFLQLVINVKLLHMFKENEMSVSVSSLHEPRAAVVC